MVVIAGNTYRDRITGLWQYFILVDRQLVWSLGKFKYERDARNCMREDVARRNREWFEKHGKGG